MINVKKGLVPFKSCTFHWYVSFRQIIERKLLSVTTSLGNEWYRKPVLWCLGGYYGGQNKTKQEGRQLLAEPTKICKGQILWKSHETDKGKMQLQNESDTRYLTIKTSDKALLNNIKKTIKSYKELKTTTFQC